MAQRANNRRQHTGPERSDPNAKIDLILVAAISIGLTLTSLTSEGSQSEYYQLPGWLVAVQPISRPGAIAMFLIALVRYFQLRGVFSLSHLAGPAWVAWIINLFLTTKVFILGDDFDFYAQALAVSVIQIFLFVICVGGEQKRRGNPSLDSSLLTNFEASIFVFSGLFAAVNLILLVVAPQAVSTWFGRFYGTTANPQHTMMLSVMCIPICALVLRGARRPAVQRAAALAVLIGLCTVVYVTGSRSGFVTALAVLSFCYVDRFTGRKFVASLYGILMIGTLSLILFGGRLWGLVFTSVQDRYITGREDTRTYVWVREFNDFVQNWQFGVPLESHGRLNFSETYWLSISSNGGIIALGLAIVLLTMLLFTLYRLTLAGMKQGSPLRYRIYAAACLAVFALSIVESILAGVIVAHTMMATGCLAVAWNTLTPRRSLRTTRRRQRKAPPAYSRPRNPAVLQ